MNRQDRARSYAEAFYAAAFERWLAGLDVAAGALNASLLDRAQTSAQEFTARQPLLDSLLPADVDPPVRNLVYILAQRGDLGLLPEVVASLRARVARTGEAETRVEITSAVPLTESEQVGLADKLTAEYGSELQFNYRVDPAILGGLIVRIGDKLIDGSVASKLAAMKQTLGITSNE